MLQSLIRAGMDIARLNFSHGTHDEHLVRLRAIREAAELEGKYIAIMLDTKGLEIRIGTFADGPITLSAGDSFTLTTRPVAGTAEQVSVTYQGLPQDVRTGDRLLLDDGLLEFRVESTT